MSPRQQRRVLFVIWGLGAGGAERVISVLTPSLASGHTVGVLRLDPTAAGHYALPDAVHSLALSPAGCVAPPARTAPPWTRPVTGPLAGIRGAWKNLRLVAALRRAFVQWRPDVVVAFIDRTILRSVLASTGTGAAVIGSERTDPRTEHRSLLHRAVQRLLYRQTAALVVQTESVAAWAAPRFGARRVVTIPNPVVLPAETADPAAGTRIVAVGRLVPTKGYDDLLRAFAAARADREGWRLDIVGEGPEQGRLEALAAELMITDAVRFRGVVTDVGAELRRATIYASASRQEGFPNALLEAMAWGLPSAVVDCPSGPAEMLDHGRTGLLVAPGDHEGLVRALRTLMGDAGARVSMGAAAREAAKAYDIARIARRWADLIDDVSTTD